jgi:hypothetical protein
VSAPAVAPMAKAPTRAPFAAAGGARGLAMEGTPSLRLPGQHFAAALFFLAAGAVGLVWIAPELAAGLYLSPHVAGVTHCFTLGFLTMTIFGALYQLLPVALGVSIRSERWGHVSFWAFAPGVAIFAAGVAASSLVLRHVGIALVATGIVVIVVNVARSLPRAKERDVIWAAITVALTFLTSTLVLGLVLVENLHTGFLAGARLRVLTVHLHIALIGWVLMMIVGISHRLLPMFLLAHGVDMRWTRRALALLAPGVAVLAAGILCGFVDALTWAGVALIEGGVTCFLVQARLLFKARMRPRLDAGLRHVAFSLVFLPISAALGPIVLYAGAGHPRLDVAYVTLGLLGGLVLYATGQFYKIVPFLVWISRFRHDMGRKPVPTVAELYSARIAHVGLASFALAIVAMISGIALGSPLVVRIGAMLFVAGVALFASQMARVAFARAPAAAGALTSPGAPA